MSNKVIICILEYEGGGTRTLYNHINISLEHLRNKNTPQEIVHGIYEYYIDRLQYKTQFKPEDVNYLAFEGLGEDLFIVSFGSRDYVIILENSEYYKWFNNMFNNSKVSENRLTYLEENRLTYLEELIAKHVMDIILDNPNKYLIVYSNGVRKE